MGGSPIAAVVRFGCEAMSDASLGRPREVQAQAKVPGAERSDPSGGRANPGAAAESEHCSAEMASHEKWVVGYRAAEPLSHGRRPKGTDEGNGPMESAPAPAYGWWHQEKGQRHKAGKVSSSRRLGAQVKDKASRGDETGGWGRSSDDAQGQHNPGGAKDPWGGGVPNEARTVPTCLRAKGEVRSRSESGTKGASNSGSNARKVAPDGSVRSRRLEAVLGKTHRTEF
jgi:hypothetical protein